MNTNNNLEFAELHCLTNFSFLRAASHPEELITRAAELQYQALAITDECSLAGVVRAWREAKRKQLDIKLIIGAEFYLEANNIVLLAMDRKGYAQISQLITRARRRTEKGKYHLFLNDLNTKTLDHCLCLFSAKKPSQSNSVIQHLKQNFDKRLWLLAEQLLDNNDDKKVTVIEQLSQQYKLPIVASSHVLMHQPQRKMLHDCLTAIKHNTPIEQVRHLIKPNAENHLRSFKKLQSIYPQAWLNESITIAQQCNFDLSCIAYNYPTDTVPGQYTPADYLRLLVNQGVQRRFGKHTEDQIKQTIEKELAFINRRKLEHYFLTVYDIVRFARQQGILCQGRGSAANSVVCYCLGITEVNPQEASLLFERFLSDSRSEDDAPDIDVDFEHERREEVIQYIYKKYGRKRAALAATVITYRRKSALRDVAKALGLDINQLDQKIANYGWRYRTKNWIDELIDDGLGLSAYQISIFKQLLTEILGFPRHLSQHVGGFILTDGVVADLVPIENASMKDRTIIQWDKNDLEALNLMKVDILALGMLSAVRKTLNYINQFQQVPLRIQNIDRADKNVFGMIQKADTVGTFQIESRAQMNMLPRLKPACYYDLVIQVAIVRPGPIHGDMVHPYLRRRQKLEPVDYPKEELKPVLERTLGIPIFQEQVIQLAMVAADFSAAEADNLRRSMASWKKTGHINKLREKLTEKMLNNNYPSDFVERINQQIEGFGEYGFPESHAAGFALIAYVSCYLKHYYPAAFCCGLLNSLPMGFYSASQLVQDAMRHNVVVLPVNINNSDWDSTLEGNKKNPDIRLGLRRVKGLNEAAGLSLLLHRPANGYKNLYQLEGVSGLNKGDIEALASADALNNIAGHRFQARWQSAALNMQHDLLSNAFETDTHTLDAPDEFENIIEDHNSTGLSLRTHIYKLLRDKQLIPETPCANQLLALAREAHHKNKHSPHDKIKIPIVVSGLITNRQMPKTSAGVTFLTLEDHTGNINLIVWLQTMQKHMKVLTTEKLVMVKGILEKSPDNDVTHIIVEDVKGLSYLLGEMSMKSRNYH